ncbi:MAG: alpha/beta hydrolase [Chloroflexota bacterium]
MPQPVSFYSEGYRIAAHLYLPETLSGKVPAVVMAHGFSGVKELLLPPYAERLASAGFAALTFDYRGFGESEGERGRLIPMEQMADIRNAVTYLQTLPQVNADAIGLWGTSFGGANAIRVAAVDGRTKALVAQLTFGSGARMVVGKMSAAEREQLEGALKKAREREVTKNRPLKLSPEQLITDDDSRAFFAQVAQDHPHLAETKIPFTLLQHIIEHNPEEEIGNVACPTLILAAENDIVTPPAEAQALYECARGVKRVVLLPNCRHYDAYAGEPFEKGIAETIAWYSSYLA